MLNILIHKGNANENYTKKKKTTVRFYLTPVSLSIIKKTKTPHSGEIVNKEPSYTVGGNVN
jgi:hypothetical protein